MDYNFSDDRSENELNGSGAQGFGYFPSHADMISNGRQDQVESQQMPQESEFQYYNTERSANAGSAGASFSYDYDTFDGRYSAPTPFQESTQAKYSVKSNKSSALTPAQILFRSKITQPDLFPEPEVKVAPVLPPPEKKAVEYENQRDALIDQLHSSTYECMVCCANVLRRQATWSCKNCHHIFHLSCIKKWVRSSAVENCWRCPGCQNVIDYYPQHYFCFCGKIKDPTPTSDIPHSCNAVCGRPNSTHADCTHSGCTIICHPGPCPVCTAQVKRKCECGKTSAFVQCSSKNPILCGQLCNKTLNCGIHKCKEKCHPYSCESCIEIKTVYCNCGKSTKEVVCSDEWNSGQKYTCNVICNKLLNCKNHRCVEKCCTNCQPCKMSVDVILSCPCGQTPIDAACRLNKLPLRKSCLDPIPTCDKACKRILPCGNSEQHFCQDKCHTTDKACPPCALITRVMCRCGNQELEIPCTEFLSSSEFLCHKKCTKKRRCGKHKCNTRCCIDFDHVCPIVCNRQLKCPHRCDLLCHMGFCPPCKNISFEELRCECGSAVIYPPVPCGTLPPCCTKPCQREHSCEHPPNHTCHSEPSCPPCTVLTSRWCFGRHELRKNVMCHITNISCGMPCNKPLNCFGGHKCERICHEGPCRNENEVCRLPCLQLRKCGHKCGAPCHEEGNCPDKPCKQLVPVTCSCGRKEEVLLCWKRELELEKVLSQLSSESGENCNKSEGLHSHEEVISRSIILKCDKECARLERIRKMAEALQLDNPDPETRLGPPNYSEFLKKFTQKNPQFVEMVHTKLTDIVMKLQKSKKINLTYSFESMNREKRTVIHEYSDHFGLTSESFDEEPNRNVVVTASKDRCWLPSVSLVNAVFCKTVTTERKNVYQDLELSVPAKSQIIGPSNSNLFSARSSSNPNPKGMVLLNGSTSTGEAWGKR